jgi:hypothetical protein
MAVSFTKVYQDSTTTPNEATTSNFDISNTLPTGMAEMVGFRYSATGALSSASVFELLTTLRLTINGDQVISWNSLLSNNASAACPRISAFAQDIGGQVDETGATTSPEGILWLPLGLNIPVNSRFELNVQWGVAGVPAVSPQFEVWIKYGASSNTTIVGNMTSELPAANAQTMVSVKIPAYKNAVVSGIAIQGATASNNLTSLIVKPLGDFAMTPNQLQGAAKAGNPYYFYDGGDSLVAYQVESDVLGYYFCPLYGLSVKDSTVVLLMEASVAENYTFTPILSIPTSGSGMATPVQTEKSITGSAKSILSRAEGN